MSTLNDAGASLGEIQAPRPPRPSDLKTLACPYENCPKTFNRQARLTEHLRSHSNDRVFKCLENGCSKDFFRESHLKAHIKSAHSGVRDYLCSWEGCNKSFATGTRLRRHEKAHEEHEKFRCQGYEGCAAVFRKHATLHRHIISVHQGVKPFPCLVVDPDTEEQCSMAFDTAEKLRAHERAKHDANRFTCLVCSESSTNLHESDPQLVPDFTFPSYALLKTHMSISHPPTCPDCSMSCSSERELKSHMELAHGSTLLIASQDLEPFPCFYPTCDRKFSKRGNLMVHIKTVHEGLKAFICGTTSLHSSKNLPQNGLSEMQGCGRSFTSRSSLEEHVRTHHMGMLSRRAERQRKRKLEAGEMPTKRRARERKPTRSTFTELTGFEDQKASDSSPNSEHQFPEWQGAYEDDSFADLLRGYDAAVPASPTHYSFASDLEEDPWPSSGSLKPSAIDPLLLTA